MHRESGASEEGDVYCLDLSQLTGESLTFPLRSSLWYCHLIATLEEQKYIHTISCEVINKINNEKNI